jgi:hypothetical protein
MKCHSSATAALIGWARSQGGVVTLTECRERSMSQKVMARLVREAVFRRAHRGVFVLAGTPDTHRTRARAALAAVGPGGVLSHGSAAWAAGLIDEPPDEVHLTVAGGCARRIPGVVVHRTCRPSRAVWLRGLRCVETPRIVLDLAGELDKSALDDVVDRGIYEGLFRAGHLAAVAVADRVRVRSGSFVGLPGVRALRRCLERRGDVGTPRPSVLESRMDRLFAGSGLPRPRCQVLAGPGGRYRIDYAYPAQRLAIEVNGYLWHHTPRQMTRDLERQRSLVMDGWTVLAYSWRDIEERPGVVASQIRRALADAGGPDPPVGA